MASNIAGLQAKVPNFRAFVEGGELHTILRRPEFYTYQANGVSIHDWITNIAAGRDVQNVHCVVCDKPEAGQ
jgi:hypothetical protein